MDFHVKNYFKADPDGGSLSERFCAVQALHEEPDFSWEEVEKKVGPYARGWSELARLSPEDRIGFTSDFWASQLPYHPKLEKFLERFFSNIDDIGVFITQKNKNDPYNITMVYNIKGDKGFYRGGLPATEDDCLNLQGQFADHILPEDYFSFARIHNGFCKATDVTGIIRLDRVREVYESFQQRLCQGDGVKTSSGKEVDPQTLLPFYESFGMPYFQCFWNEWHPEQEMGNVYCSLTEMMISDPKEGEGGVENLAFKTYIDWVMFYLEQID